MGSTHFGNHSLGNFRKLLMLLLEDVLNIQKLLMEYYRNPFLNATVFLSALINCIAYILFELNCKLLDDNSDISKCITQFITMVCRFNVFD